MISTMRMRRSTRLICRNCRHSRGSIYERKYSCVSHKSSSRAGYAQGSLRAVRFLADKPAGLYDMLDVLNLR